MKSAQGWSRREVLGAALAAGLPVSFARAASQKPPDRQRRGELPRNIVFMVSDGMSAGVPSLAEPFSRLVRGQGTRWYGLLRDAGVTHGCFEMGSLNSLVTDSAAAVSAWATGSRVFNGSINVLPDGTRLTPIAPLMRDAGRRIGLVTTTMIAHATPAGFAAVQPCRDDMHLIAPQYLDLVDVALGGGREHFDPAWRPDRRDLIGEFTSRGYTFSDHRDALLGSASATRLLGLFGVGHLPYTVDHRNSARLARAVPTLAEMTRTALEVLSRAGRGFLLQVEGGRVDHAAHANDAAAILWDQLAFDDALGVVLEFQQRNPDTLVVITTDHGNANPGLNGTGTRYRDTDECFERIALATASFGEIKRRLGGAADGRSGPAVDAVVETVRGATGVELAAAEARAVANALVGSPTGEIARQQRNFVATLGQALGNHNGVGWTGISHTADLVISTAFGPGQKAFAGLLRNTDAFARMTRLAGVSFTNPHLTAKQAARFGRRPVSAAAARHTAGTLGG